MSLTCLAQGERRIGEEPGAQELEGGRLGGGGHREPPRPGRVRLGQPGPGPGRSQPSHHKTRRGGDSGPAGCPRAPGGGAVEVHKGSWLWGGDKATGPAKPSPSTVRTWTQTPALRSDLGHETAPLRASFSPPARWP